MAVYMSMCARCAEKIGKHRSLYEASMSFFGRCPQCFTPSKLIQYDVGPSVAELDRKRRQARPRIKTKQPAAGNAPAQEGEHDEDSR